jgi:hypothetical protein
MSPDNQSAVISYSPVLERYPHLHEDAGAGVPDTRLPHGLGELDSAEEGLIAYVVPYTYIVEDNVVRGSVPAVMDKDTGVVGKGPSFQFAFKPIS